MRFLVCWHVYELSTWQHVKAQSSYVDVTTGKERWSRGGPIGQAQQRTSDQSVCVCTCAHQYLNRLCEFAGALACVCVWGYLVVFVKTNSIPAVCNIPASHWHNAAIGPVRRGPTVANCSPHSGHVSPARLSFSLANILFSCRGLFAFLKKERHATFCKYKRETSVAPPGLDSATGHSSHYAVTIKGYWTAPRGQGGIVSPATVSLIP